MINLYKDTFEQPWLIYNYPNNDMNVIRKRKRHGNVVLI